MRKILFLENEKRNQNSQTYFLEKLSDNKLTKAVNVEVYQRRDNNSDTAGKVKNEARQQMNNLFQRLCSVPSFLLSRKYL